MPSHFLSCSQAFWTKQVDYERLSYEDGQVIPMEPEHFQKDELAYLLDQNPIS